MQQFPQVAIARSLLQLVRGFQQEFGLTPSARTRIEIAPEKEDNPLMQLIEEVKRSKNRPPPGA